MIWLKTFGVDIDPGYEDAEHNSDDCGQIKIQERVWQGEVVDVRREDNSAISVADGQRCEQDSDDEPAKQKRNDEVPPSKSSWTPSQPSCVSMLRGPP